jgi:bifunctional UDP-N-acetylglucosamine pyrophosphorylase / glucosamine-1-phosphate N-acetyltransferase
MRTNHRKAFRWIGYNAFSLDYFLNSAQSYQKVYMMSLSVVILAAGQGTRMKSQTPKVLHAISGKPMLLHVIEAAQSLSDDITVVLYHQADRVRQALESAYDNLRFHIQDAERYPGTGGAMRGVTPKHQKTLILNGDMPLVSADAIGYLVEENADIVMSVICLEDPSGYGRVMIDQGQVQHIVEEKDCNAAQKETRTVNAGVYCVDTELLKRYVPALGNDNAQQEYYLTDIIEMAVQEGRTVRPAYVEEEDFKGVNSKLDLAYAEEIMQRRIRAHWMRQGVIMRLPETIYIDARARLEGECILENGVALIGNTTLKEAHIKAHSVIEEAMIDASSIGPMARIRPGSQITKSQIGNFVEVKKSTLEGVKAGHLSYLGDASIGTGSNIGAGTITCNYDGRAKYQTVIGKNVFVGSDTQLVAPVTIADDVMIAAGTTVTRDISQGELALSRTPMKTIKGFFYKFFRKATT